MNIKNLSLISYISILSILILFLPASFLFPLIIVLSYFFWHRLTQRLFLAIIIIGVSVSLLNWGYIGIGYLVWEWDFVKINITVRIFTFGLLFLYIFKYFTISKASFEKPIILLLVLVLYSLIKSSDINIAVQYLANVYIPFVFTIWFINGYLTNSINYKNSTGSLYELSYFMYVILFINFSLVALDQYELLDLNNFFLSTSSLIRGEEAEGIFRTHLFGEEYVRQSGIFSDSINAGYFLTTLLIFTLLVIKNILIKLLTSFIILYLILLTLAKSSFLMLALAFLGFVIIKIKLSKNIKSIVLILMYITFFVLILLKAINSQNIDSSYIHYLGLSLPFFEPINVNYLIGNDLGSGGNMGGWVQQGAESFVGLLMYNLGLVGVFIYFYYIIKILRKSFEATPIFKLWTICIFLPIFFASLLQENSFNLVYSLPRLLLTITIIDFLSRRIKIETISNK